MGVLPPSSVAPRRRRRGRPLIASAMALVTLTLGGCEQIKELVSPPVAVAPQLRLTADRATVPVGGGDVTIEAEVTQASSPLVGTTVQFAAPGAEFIGDSRTVTDASGIARAKLRITQPTSVRAALVALGVDVSTSAEIPIAVDGAVPGSVRISLEQNPRTIEVDAPVEFTVEALTSDGAGVRGDLTVEFGDGRQERVRDFQRRATVAHTYRDSANFELTVILDKADGTATERTFDIKVLKAEELRVDLEGPDEVEAGEMAAFTITLSEVASRRPSAEVSVDWGDGRSDRLGEVSGRIVAEHSYRNEGSYQVKVEATGDDDKVQKATARVRVAERVDVSVQLDTGVPVAGLRHTMVVRAERSDRSTARGTASVSFGDGTRTTVPVSQGVGEVEHTWESEGTYDIVVGYIDVIGVQADRLYRVKVEKEQDIPVSSLDLHGATIASNSNQGIASFRVTSTVTKVTIDPSQICQYHTKAGQWPVRSGLEGNPWVAAVIDGKLHAGTYEWLRPGQICKGITAGNIGPHVKNGPLAGWRPKKGERVWFFVSTHARVGVSSTNERSQPVEVIWPY